MPNKSCANCKLRRICYIYQGREKHQYTAPPVILDGVKRLDFAFRYHELLAEDCSYYELEEGDSYGKIR